MQAEGNSTTLGFPGEIEESLRQVRELFVAIVEAVCGVDVRAKDVSDRFGLHAKLGWQIWNVANSDPLTGYRFLPNEHGIKVWRLAATQRGIPAELFDRLEGAVGGLHHLIEVHAGDEQLFEMLVDAQTAESYDDVELKWRKQAFLGNAFTFGARAKCQLACAILYPSMDGERFSIVRIHGLIELVRTRIGVRWPISTLVVERPDGTSNAPKREPLLDSPDYSGPVPFLTQYCSKPLPAVERRSDGERIHDDLLPGLVGLTGATTVFTGEILHNLGPATGFSPGEVAHFGSGTRTPTELFIADHIVHHSLFAGMERELRIYSELTTPNARGDSDRLHVSETLQRLGRGLQRIRTADVPNYAELLTDTFAKIGADPNEFDVYRVSMRFPPMPVSVMVRHPLAPPLES